MSLKRTGKFLNFGTANGTFPTLCLNVDNVQAELVLFNDSIDAAVAALAYCTPSISSRPAVTHCYEQVDDKAFKECGR